jgi:hypothetical protein
MHCFKALSLPASETRPGVLHQYDAELLAI